MAVSMDDKLLGEKAHYYCSSSEDEDEGESGGGAKFTPASELGDASGAASNTGPKGVIEDWRRFKQLEREDREGQKREKELLTKKLAMTCRTAKEDLDADTKEQKQDEDLEALLDDEFLASYMERRMREMMDSAQTKSKIFGQVIDLSSADAFLDGVDKEDKGTKVIVLIYEEGVEGSEASNGCLAILAKDHPSAKFMRIRASTAGLSRHFKVKGVPTLLVYKGGELISSFVRLTDTLGDDFYAADLESHLIQHGILSDRELVPSIIRGPAEHAGRDDDSE